MNALIINAQSISQHNGLYSLTDLHRASGSENKHKPNYFLTNQETKELIAEIESDNTIAYHTINGGNNRGTYACRELVIRYGMWISPKFSLMVIRAFDAMNTGAIPCLARQSLSVEQQAQIQKAVRQKCQSNSTHYQTVYTALKDKFGVPSYKDILASEFDQALAFIVGYEFSPTLALNIPFIQNVLADALYQNRKAQTELNDIRTIVKGLLHHLEDTQDHLARNERNVLALKQRFIA